MESCSFRCMFFLLNLTLEKAVWLNVEINGSVLIRFQQHVMHLRKCKWLVGKLRCNIITVPTVWQRWSGMVIIDTKDLCLNAWESQWTVSCAIWHSLKCCQTLWIYFRVGHFCLPSHEVSSCFFFFCGKNVGNIMFRVLKCLLICFSWQDSLQHDVSNFLHFQQGTENDTFDTRQHIFPFQLCVATWRCLFPMQCFPLAEGKERATVIFYEDFSSLLPVLTMTSLHSSCLSQLPSSLRFFISPEWRCEICGLINE